MLRGSRGQWGQPGRGHEGRGLGELGGEGWRGGGDAPAPSTPGAEGGIRAFSPVSWSRSRSSDNSDSDGDNLDGGRTAARAMGGPGRHWARAGGA